MDTLQLPTGQLHATEMGIEPALNSDATDILPCSCVNCQQCRAARALHFGCPDWPSVASSDADLQRIIAAWDALPQAIRVAVMAVIATVASATDHSPLAQGNRPGLDEIARRTARKCRQEVQGCLREEEWLDADQEFFDIIISEMRSAADKASLALPAWNAAKAQVCETRTVPILVALPF